MAKRPNSGKASKVKNKNTNNNGSDSTNRSESTQQQSAAAHTNAAPSGNNNNNNNNNHKGRFTIHLTFGFLLLTLLLSTIAAFSIGWLARLVLLSNMGIFPSSQSQSSSIASIDTMSNTNSNSNSIAIAMMDSKSKKENPTMSRKLSSQQLPAPKVIEGKDVPYTTYASKTFHTAGAATANTLHIDRTAVLLMSTMGKSRKGEGGLLMAAKEPKKGIAGADDDDDDGDDDDSSSSGNGYVPCHAEDGVTKCSRGKAPIANENDATTNDTGNDTIVNDYSHNNDEDGLHLPAGQHLLVDIKDVDSNFLNSEERLALAMIELINESKLTLLSYHCHSLVPIGVSCVGVLLESHISFHTWPLEGVITLDLFTCGGNPLVPVMPSIERLFGVAREVDYDDDDDENGESSSMKKKKEEVVQPSILWAHKLRGFREGFAPNYNRESNPLDQDLGRYVLGKLDFDIKRPTLSTETDFQRVDVYELIYPHTRNADSYEKSLTFDGENETTSYESSHPEFFAPDRVLFLDGVIQSSLYGDAAYHESIVHPAMITHSNPKRVAIIGGGEGATLREALKHETVETVVMIEIDQEIVELSREYLSEWSDCSDIIGSASWCLEDRRVDARYEDAIHYFKSRFAKKEEVEEDARFDVIVMDALDPNIDIDFVLDLYKSDEFIGSLYNALTESGVLAVQVGETPSFIYPADEVGPFANRAIMMQKLEETGFKSMHIYEESHSGFQWPWSTLVAFKDYSSRANWYKNPAEINLEIRKRLLPTKSGASSLRNYDGATHLSYQMPSKPFETTYCRAIDTPDECNKYRGFLPNSINVPATSLKVKKISRKKSAELGVYARNEISKNTAIAMDQQVNGLSTLPTTWAVIKSLENKGTDINQVINFMEGRGFCNMFMGKTHCCSDAGVLNFMRQGSSDNLNYGENASTENKKTAIFSPVVARHVHQLMSSSKVTLRDIRAGEEIVRSNGHSI